MENRHRQAVERRARGVERAAEHADVLAWRRGRDNTRFDRGGERLHPGGADLVKRAVKAEAVDFRIGGETGDQDGDIVASAFAIDGFREQECSPVVFGNPAAILPADQGMHFGIFVDWLVDDDQ